MASAAANSNSGAKAGTKAGDEQDVQPLSGVPLILAGFALALANFIVVLDTTIANVSVPHIAGGLAISPTQGTWVITSYSVADAISVPLTGFLASRFGTVRWLMASLIGFAVFSLLCGLSSSLEMLVVFRILQGLSGGPLMPLTQSLLLRVFPKHLASAALGIWAMTTVCAPIAGPILGGLISDNWSWPWIFFINIPLIGVVLFGIFTFVRPFETKQIKARIDIVGLVLLVTWVGAFQLMLDTGRDDDWFNSTWVVSLAIVSAIGFVAFVIWELGESLPAVDLRVFRHRGFTVSTAAISLGFGAFFASVVLTPLWMQQVLGYTATDAGYATAWSGVFAVILSPIAAALTTKVDMRFTISMGILWLGIMSLLRAQWSTDSTFYTLSIPQLLQGIGMPFFFVGLTTLALASVPKREVTSAAGLMSFMRTLSGAIGTATATTAWNGQSRIARSEIVPTINGAASTISSIESRGMSHEQARSALDRIVEAQASTLGASHVFTLAFGVFLLASIIIWFAPKPNRAVAPGAAH